MESPRTRTLKNHQIVRSAVLTVVNVVDFLQGDVVPPPCFWFCCVTHHSSLDASALPSTESAEAEEPEMTLSWKELRKTVAVPFPGESHGACGYRKQPICQSEKPPFPPITGSNSEERRNCGVKCFGDRQNVLVPPFAEVTQCC